MPEENNWQRMAKQLNAIQEKILAGTHGIFQGSDAVTILTNQWVIIMLDLNRSKLQCAAYGEYRRRLQAGEYN